MSKRRWWPSPPTAAQTERYGRTGALQRPHRHDDAARSTAADCPDYLDVIDAERSLYQSQMELVNLVAQQYINYVNALQGAGRRMVSAHPGNGTLKWSGSGNQGGSGSFSRHLAALPECREFWAVSRERQSGVRLSGVVSPVSACHFRSTARPARRYGGFPGGEILQLFRIGAIVVQLDRRARRDEYVGLKRIQPACGIGLEQRASRSAVHETSAAPTALNHGRAFSISR